MNRRHLPLPRVWMLTDERQGEAIWDMIANLPRGTGIVVRHYSLSEDARARMFRRVKALARKQGLTVAFSGTDRRARQLGADAVYGKGATRSILPRLFPAHGRREIVAAERAGAALILLSPAYATRTHPGARSLGSVRFGALAGRTRIPVIALGGMTDRRYRRLIALGAQGWAAIDAWIRT